MALAHSFRRCSLSRSEVSKILASVTSVNSVCGFPCRMPRSDSVLSPEVEVGWCHHQAFEKVTLSISWPASRDCVTGSAPLGALQASQAEKACNAAMQLLEGPQVLSGRWSLDMRHRCLACLAGLAWRRLSPDAWPCGLRRICCLTESTLRRNSAALSAFFHSLCLLFS